MTDSARTPPPSAPFNRDELMLRRRHRHRSMALGVSVLLLVGLVLVLLTWAGSDTRSTTLTTAPGTKPVPTSTSLPTTAQPGTGGMLPFSASSFWNTPLPADAPLASNSHELVRSFNNQWRTFYGTVGINTNDYSIPIYTVPADQPPVPVSIAAGCNEGPGILEQLGAVPIPVGARPANGGDHTLVIWQPETDTEWEIWMAKQAADDSWSACWGGRIQNVSKSQGVFPNPYGVAASGLSYLAGSMKVSELQAGEINHALAVVVVHTTADSQVAPATRNDGNSTAADAIPQGTRFRLDPTVDVTKLGLSDTGVTIARALQTYGMFVTDTSGAVVLMAEDGQPYIAAGRPDPYAEIFGRLFSYQVLANVPWDRLQVVRPGT